ncbi:MAG: alpha/beta fold hydrolase [Acidimicrobiales bacterium]
MGRLAEENAVWPKDRFLSTSDGATLAYAIVGDGAKVPVVFMNGWTCPDTYWGRIGPAIVEAGHRVVFFDTRGHGQSSLPVPPRHSARDIPVGHVSVSRVATDIIEILDHAGIDRAVLVGHSMGVQGIFEAYRVGGSARLAGIVPVAGTYENPVPTFAEKAVLDKLFPIGDALLSRVPFGLMRPVMAQAHKMPPALTMRIIKALLRTGPEVQYADVERHVRQISEVDFSIMWRMMSQMRGHSAADVLPTIEVPVLILGGERDHFTPPSVQHRMHELIPGSELVLYPDGGHLLPVEEWRAISRDLVSWLADNF